VHHAGRPRVIDYLNKGLRSELTAINQYWLHYRVLNNWGLLRWPRSGARIHRGDAPRHKFTDRSCSSTASQHASARSAATPELKEIIECDLAAEIGARTLYQEAATYCHGVKDYVSRDVRKPDEGRGRAYRFSRDPARLSTDRLELYTQKHVGHLKGERTDKANIRAAEIRHSRLVRHPRLAARGKSVAGQSRHDELS